MKYAMAIITFSMCLLAILESGYTLKCYQCTVSQPGCFETPSVPKSYIKPCPSNIRECAVWAKLNPKNKSQVVFINRECLAGTNSDKCYNDPYCGPCSEDDCNYF